MSNYDYSIIIIGPMGVGKSTVSKMLAKELSLKYIDCDKIKYRYYKRIPEYNKKEERKAKKSNDKLAHYTYMKPFELAFVEMCLMDNQTGIIDMGAGHSVYEIEYQKNKILQILKPYKYIFCLLYSSDVNESIVDLNHRHWMPNKATYNYYSMLNEHFINNITQLSQLEKVC